MPPETCSAPHLKVAPTRMARFSRWSRAAGAVTTLASFDVTNGEAPIGALSLDAAGNIYGIASSGGANGWHDLRIAKRDGRADHSCRTTGPCVALLRRPPLSPERPLSPAVTVSVEDMPTAIPLWQVTSSTINAGDRHSGPAGAAIGGNQVKPRRPSTAVATFSNLSFNEAGDLHADGNRWHADIGNLREHRRLRGLKSWRAGTQASASAGWHRIDVGLTSTAGLAVQDDGKSVIAGTIGSTGSQSFGITRYNADGTLDTSFGANGVTAYDASPALPNAQHGVSFSFPDGDILVAGTDTTLVNSQSTGSQFALVEYTSDGVLDTTFGNGAGYVLTKFFHPPPAR